MTTLSPLVHYQFGCNALGEAELVTSGPMLETLALFEPPTCHFSSDSVSSATLIESNSTISTLQDASLHAEADGLAIELWMTIEDEQDEIFSKPIITIGSSGPAADLDLDECSGMKISLRQLGNSLELQYSDDDEAQSCQSLMVPLQTLDPDTLRHIVVAFNDGETNIYANGVPAMESAANHFSTDLSTWNSDYKLQLFASRLVKSAYHFTGSIKEVALYNEAVSNEQAGNLYDQGSAKYRTIMATRMPLIHVAQADPVVLVQGEQRTFTVGGFHSSTSKEWNTFLEIASVPQYGALSTPDGSVLSIGSRIPLDEDSNHTSFLFQPWFDDFFTSPRLSYSGKDLQTPQETFSYRLIAIDNEDAAVVVGSSEPVVQEVVVVRTNHPPTLVVPYQTSLVPQQTEGMGGRPQAQLQGVLLKDSDQNIDRVRVDVWTYNGTLTIPEHYLALADFSSCRANQRPTGGWNCHGTGTANRNMTFVAEPDRVSQILSRIIYQGFHWDQQDIIVIRIYDGSGGPCLSAYEHKKGRFAPEMFPTIRDGCYEIETTVTVPGIAQVPRDAKNTGGYLKAFFDFRDFGIADMIFWCCLVACISASFLSIRSCIRCWAARGSKVYPEEEEIVWDEENTPEHTRASVGNGCTA